MLRPDEVLERLHRRFGTDYVDWARGKGAWPLRISLRPPGTAQRSESPITCHEWAACWEAYTGPGTLEFANLRFPTGTHRMPKTLVLGRPGDVAAAHPDDRALWQRCGRRLTHLQTEFPGARLSGQVRRITGLDDADFARLVGTVRWLRANPTSGLLLRQLPIEGIDTKWLGAHRNLVLALLGGEDDVEPRIGEPPKSRKRALHHRLGLKVVPELVQVTVCDPLLRNQLAGMRHLAAPVEDLDRWPRRPATVVILENKETAFAVTADHSGTVILHGHGFFVDQYARIIWVRNADRVIYWGDLDTAGLQFVSDLRAVGVAATTILTDTETLDRFRHLAVEGTVPQRKSIPQHLTEAERELYHVLVEHAARTGTGLLLEQERIPWEFAHPRLLNAIGTACSARKSRSPSA